MTARTDHAGPAGAIVAATFFWGATSAAFALIDAPALAAGAIVALSAGAALLMLAGVTGNPVVGEFRDHARIYLRVGLLEAANLTLYVFALQIGQLPVVAALHLTAPVILVAWHLIVTRSRPSLVTTLELALIAAAIALATGTTHATETATHPVLGAALALASAVALAALISQAVVHAPAAPAFSGPGLQLVIAGATVAPLVFLDLPSAKSTAILAAIGCFVFSAGFALYWIGLRRAGAMLASILGLAEVVFASAIGALLGASALSPATVVASACILLATAIELRRGRQPEPPPIPSF